MSDNSEQLPVTPVNTNNSPPLKTVMGTTAKVLLSLVVISLAVGLVVALIDAIGTGVSNSSSGTSSFDYEKTLTDEAGAVPSSMPLSQWKKLVSAATKEHCGMAGMTGDEIERSLGVPQKRVVNSDSSKDWMYQTTESICDKYSGDVCSEKHDKIKEQRKLHFTPQGTFAFQYDNSSGELDAYNPGTPGTKTSECFSLDQPLVYQYATHVDLH